LVNGGGNDLSGTGHKSVIAVDTNILVYAHREDSPQHERAKARLLELSRTRFAIPWPCIHEFWAIITHPKIFDPPTDVSAAELAVEGFLKCSRLELLSEREGYFDILLKLLRENHIKGPMVHDARIMALCIQHGIDELWTADRDFGRFAEIKIVNPLK
jgi:toxin-antitoxin system PIN domain toxin